MWQEGKMKFYGETKERSANQTQNSVNSAECTTQMLFILYEHLYSHTLTYTVVVAYNALKRRQFTHETLLCAVYLIFNSIYVHM